MLLAIRIKVNTCIPPLLQLLEKKMVRMEKAKEAEVAALRTKVELSQDDVRAQLKAKDDRMVEVGARMCTATYACMCTLARFCSSFPVDPGCLSQ